MGARHSTGKVRDQATLNTATSESPKPRASQRQSLPSLSPKSSSPASPSRLPEPAKQWQDINVAKAALSHRKVSLKDVCLQSPRKSSQSRFTSLQLPAELPSKPNNFVSPAKVLLQKQTQSKEAAAPIQFEQEDSVRAFYNDSGEAKIRPIQVKSSSTYHLIKHVPVVTPTPVALSARAEGVIPLLKEAAALNSPQPARSNQRVVNAFVSKSPMSVKLPRKTEGGFEAEAELYRIRKQVEVVQKQSWRPSTLRIWKGRRGSVLERQEKI